MTTKTRVCCRALALLALSTLNLQPSTIFAQGTAFTYQGRLNNGGAPVNGNYDLRFTLFATNISGGAIAGPVTNSAAVSNGLFTTTVDFGPGAFTGDFNWLEIAVSTNGANAFSTLAPRQQIMPVPYALVAENINGLQIQNNGTVMFGGSDNTALAGYATIIGGVFNKIETNADFSAIGGGTNNTIEAGSDGGNIGGGAGNLIQDYAWESAIGGGRNNWIETAAYRSAISGGYFNTIGKSSPYTFIGGGNHNIAQSNSVYTVIVGGASNSVSGGFAVIGGGERNTASGSHAVIVGGIGNLAGSDGDAVVGGISNSAAGDPSFIGAGMGNRVGNFSGFGIGTIAANSFVVAGVSNNVQSDNSGIGGGAFNLVQSNAYGSFIGGGLANTIQTNNSYSSISGGAYNFIGSLTNDYQTNNYYSVIGGGCSNLIRGSYSAIPGGSFNTVGQPYDAVNNSLAAGHRAKVYGSGTFAWADSTESDWASYGNNEFLIRASGGVGVNTATPGAALDVSTPVSSPNWTAIQGISTGGYGVYGDSTSSYGILGDSFSSYGVYGRTYSGTAVSGYVSSGAGLAGDFKNLNGNEAAFGTAGYAGYFTGNVDVNGSLTIEGHDTTQLIFHDAGVYDLRWYGEKQAAGYTMTLLDAGNGRNNLLQVDNYGNVKANAYGYFSDRNAKENFTMLDAGIILAKVVALPITEWNYKTEGKQVRHVGPMAQDFHAAFSLDGVDDKHISVVDEGGVALAAIQGLNQKVEEKDAEIERLKQSVDELKEIVSKLAAAQKPTEAK